MIINHRKLFTVLVLACLVMAGAGYGYGNFRDLFFWLAAGLILSVLSLAWR